MGRRPGYVLVGSALGLLLAFMAALIGYGTFGTSIHAEKPVVVQVRPGESLRQFSNRLASEGVLSSPDLLTALGVLRGDSARIQAGEYVFEGRVAPLRLLDDLVSGRIRVTPFTVPEGHNMAEIAAQLEARSLGSAKRFLALARDPQFIASLNLPFRTQPGHHTPPTLEGFLFPETYYVNAGMDEKAIIRVMVRQFMQKASDVLITRAKEVGLTPYEVLILASIVEKETGVGSERPLVSAVFHNRLRVNMRLRTDPAVIYGVPNFNGNLTRKHLRTWTPYNTYENAGLPPTPIANPGLAAIQATLAPAEVDYLYFVARGDGTHVFSKDYRTHKKYVDQYQIRPHRRGSS